MLMKKEKIRALHSEIVRKVEVWNQSAKDLKGEKVRILSNYNGQDYGKSKKSLNGTTQTIANATVSDDHGLIISLVGYEYGCPYLEIDEWEIIE